MEVILLENVENLGATGDIVTVKDGYARNFLVPRSLAVVCTKSNRKMIEEQKKILAVKKAKEMEQFKAIAEKIANISCTIKVQAGEDDKLFGSVTNSDIANALEAEGVKVERRRIKLDAPIKQLGVFNLTVDLHPEVQAELKVWVVKE